MGMGDHVPEFMLVELRPALASVAAEPEERAEKPVEAVEAAVVPTDKPRRSRNRRKKGEARVDAAAPVEAPATEVVEAVTEAPAPVEQDEPVVKAPVEAAPAEAAAETLAEMPVTEAPATETPSAEPVADEAPKPKRTRRKKTDEAPVAAPQADADAEA